MPVASESDDGAAAPSAKISVRPETKELPPASDINITFCPDGPASMMSTSFGKECVRLSRRTRRFEIAPEMPLTVRLDGYGVATPDDGIAMGVWDDTAASSLAVPACVA